MRVTRRITGLLMPLLLTMWTIGATAKQDSLQTAQTDSAEFVTASLLIGSPLPAIYSVFGHATLRMECPTEGLDYVFTFESDPSVSGFMTGVAGKAKAKFVAIPAKQYIDDARALGRELWQYRLNLTPDEKKELWRNLDNEMMAGSYRHFNLLYTNCLTTAITTMQRSLIGEHFEWGPAEYPMTLCDGDLFRLSVQHVPWSEFVYVTFEGTAYDQYSQTENRLFPEMAVPLLRKAAFVNDSTGARRPVITDTGRMILKGKPLAKSSFTPTTAFALLLVLTLLITIAERLLRWKRLAKIYDIVLFTAQLIVGILIIYVTFCSELFPGKWNWYLVAFFPVPLILWLLHPKASPAPSKRRGDAIGLLARTPLFVRAGCRSGEALGWLCYSIVLLLFIAATPLLGALDLPHQLITASLAVRSVNRVFSS